MTSEPAAPPGMFINTADELLTHRRLAIQVRPMTAETLPSYLRRLGDRNYLRPALLPSLARRPDLLPILSTLTGYSEHHLVSALPQLRTPAIVRAWPHLASDVSARAGTRPACRLCVAARLRTEEHVIVFASHEQLTCPTHRRWLGNGWLKCARPQQFSIRSCPEISAANVQHKRLITQWGRGPTHASFADAVTCLSIWSRWPVVMHAPDIQRRWQRLGVSEQTPPLTPAEIAAWYPNAVALTQLILTQRRQIAEAHGITRDIEARGIARLKEDVIAGLISSGAFDPYRHAITSDRPEPDTEIETPGPPPKPQLFNDIHGHPKVAHLAPGRNR